MNEESARYEVNVEGQIHPWSKGTISVPEIRELGGFSDDRAVLAVDLSSNTEKTLPEDAVHDLIPLQEGKPLVKRTAFKQASQ